MNDLNQESEDDETDIAKRASAMKFLEENDDKDEYDCDSSNDSPSPLMPNQIQESLRAHSPSPIRKRGSLLNLFSTSN